MKDAIEICGEYGRGMMLAAEGAATGLEAAQCARRSEAAITVECFLLGFGKYNELITHDKAIRAAKRAWGDVIPPEVAAALGI